MPCGLGNGGLIRIAVQSVLHWWHQGAGGIQALSELLVMFSVISILRRTKLRDKNFLIYIPPPPKKYLTPLNVSFVNFTVFGYDFDL